MKKRLLTLVFGCLLVGTTLACDLRRIEIDQPDLLTLHSAKLLDLGFDAETLAEFPVSKMVFDHVRTSKPIRVPVEGGGTVLHPVRYARIVMQTDVDGGAIVRKYEDIVRQEIGEPSCEERASPWGFRIEPTADGRAVGFFNVRYEQWTCGGFHYIRCNKLKCGKAYKEVKNKWFQKTLDFRTDFTTQVSESGVSVFYENKRTTKLNDLEKFFGPLFTGGRRKFNETMDAMDVSGWAANIGSKTSLESGGIPDGAMPRYEKVGTGFFKDQTRSLFLRLHAASPEPLDEAEYCFGGWPEIRRVAAMIRSTAPGAPVEHVVGPNDSLWRIAEATYGDGRYISALMGANPALRNRPDLLKSGEKIELPLMYKLASAPGAVRDGDSVSRVSSRIFGTKDRTREIVSKNDWLQGNPDLVFPTQVLDVPNE